MAPLEGKWLGCMHDIDVNPTKPKSEESSFAEIAMARGSTTKPKPPPTDPIEVPKDPIPPLPPDNGPMDACTKTKGLPVVMQVLIVDMLQPDNNTNEIKEIPTLVALFKSVQADYNLVVFSNGLYNEEDGHVQLQSTPPMPTSTGPVNGPGSPAMGSIIMRLQLQGDALVGQYFAPQKLADVTFHRIR
jgi:hypothetical protein